MRVFTNLLFKVTLSSMIVTAPSMITGSKSDGGSFGKELTLPYYSSAVIRKFVDHSTITAAPLYSEGRRGAPLYVRESTLASPEIRKAVLPEVRKVAPLYAKKEIAIDMERGEAVEAEAEKKTFAGSKSAELRMVINEAVMIYADMSLEKEGLDEQAFEYAWRGYHNLLKRRLIRKRSVLSICDFSQSSCSKRMYVIDVRHRKLLYRTYVAHGQNSGDEYATSFSNEPDSYKSSLGFYITKKTYIGHNGLSLRIDGVDTGYNDKAVKRNIVLHGSSYATDKYMADYGTLGTSLGCPAIPPTVSHKIIRAVKNGSCLFIYHPTPTYLENSVVINDSNG
jgi:hypothetical protein